MPRFLRALPALLVCSLVAACEAGAPAGSDDEYLDATGLTGELGLECGGATVCSGSPTGANDVYTTAYRAGTSDTSQGELAQTFVAPVSGRATQLRLQVRSLRRYAGGPGLVYLHAALRPAAAVEASNLSGAAVATGEYDLGANPAATIIDVPLSAGALVAGERYAVVVSVDAPAEAGAQTSYGLAALRIVDDPAGAALRRTARRLDRNASWVPTRFRPAGTWDLAFALTLSTVPDAPTGVTATAANASATVEWTAPATTGASALASYTVTAEPGGATATTLDGSTTSVVVPGLANGTAYTFTVVATNAQGTSPASGASAAVTPRTVPGAPTSFTATATGSAIALAWSAPASNGGAAITGYALSRATSAGGPYAPLSTTTQTSASDVGLAAGTTFFYRLVAENAAGAGASASANATTAPGAPTGLTATPGTTQVTLGWSATPAAASYVVLRSTTNGTGHTAIAWPTSAAYTDTGLAGGTTYFYVVKAVNPAGTSAASAQVSATPASALGITCSGTNVVQTANKCVFSYAGSLQTISYSGAGTLAFKLWGAGGGSQGRSWATGINYAGGGGGATVGSIAITGSGSLSVLVGQGGSGTEGVTAYGGGAAGGYVDIGAGGGGRSAVRADTTELLTAGGGGGAGGETGPAYGGAGGGTAGANGAAGAGYACYGTGGTQSAGGVPGTCNYGTGSSGQQFQGGTINYCGGGGGGGWWGGGPGNHQSPSITCGGGGGGSGYAAASVLSPQLFQGGSGGAPARSADADWASGIGVGGVGTASSRVNGGHGRVVVTW